MDTIGECVGWQVLMAQVLGSLPHTWETEKECGTPGFSLAKSWILLACED